jgi:hypothetical protein
MPDERPKPRRRELALALARGRTIRGAAREAGYSERHAHRLLEDPSFRKRVTELRGRLFDRTVGILAVANAAAAKTLTSLLDDDSSAIRLAAARSILEVGTKLRDSTELGARCDELERMFAEQKKEDGD